VRLRQEENGLRASTSSDFTNPEWRWLRQYLQLEVDLEQILATFPKDSNMELAVESCRGLRLLRQEPWECLASFILSSTKQIVQIQQIVELLCSRFGSPVIVPDNHPPAFSFPSAGVLAALSENDLRCCKMGFRAPYLRASARMVVESEVNLTAIAELSLESARNDLMRLPGVGRKIADCVLLFAYGFPEAFPVDVWVMKALRQLYFPKRRKSPKKILEFSQTYFGPNAGYAQQYLFHYMRTRHRENKS
jgi:N-glycosylase/DNA lyase